MGNFFSVLWISSLASVGTTLSPASNVPPSSTVTRPPFQGRSVPGDVFVPFKPGVVVKEGGKEQSFWSRRRYPGKDGLILLSLFLVCTLTLLEFLFAFVYVSYRFFVFSLSEAQGGPLSAPRPLFLFPFPPSVPVTIYDITTLMKSAEK